MVAVPVGFAAAAGTTLAMPAHQAGDLIVAWAYQGTSNTNTIPLPAGYTATAGQSGAGANSQSSRLAYKVATSNAEPFGEWTNAEEVAVHVVRGFDPTRPIGGTSTMTGVADVTFPEITLEVTDGTSMVLAFAGWRTSSGNLGAATFSGLTQRTNVANGAISRSTSYDTNGGVAAFPTTSSNQATGFRYRTVAIEVRAAPNAAPGPIAGSSTANIPAISAQAAARLALAAVAVPVLGAVLTATSATHPILARFEATLGDVSAQGAAGAEVSGAATLLPGAITASASGSIPLRASATSSLDAVSIIAAGGVEAMAGSVAEVTLGPVIGSSAAFAYLAGTASITLGAVEVAALGGWEPSGDYDTIDIPSAHRFVVPARQRQFVVPSRPRSFSISKGTCMSMITKYAAEERQYQADWSADLNGQSIVGEIGATSTDPELIVDRVTHDGAVMKFWLQGGTPGRFPKIEFRIETSGGEDIVWRQTVEVSA